MSYWSLRRVAERAAAGHELARQNDDDLATAAPAPTHDAFGVELVRPAAASLIRHPVTIATPRRTLRGRAAALEQALWIVPVPDPLDADPLVPGPVRGRARSRW